MEPIEVFRQAWGFTGLSPIAIVQTNPFGNALVEASNGLLWHLCPEELSCQVVADSRAALAKLLETSEFREDWTMSRPIDLATATHGPLSPGRCFCLKVPAALGGSYEKSNISTISTAELWAASGDMAKQIADLPDGAQVSLDVVD